MDNDDGDNYLSADDIYDVEAIIDKRWNKTLKTHEYLIKWLNYSDQDNTWIIECDLVNSTFI